MIQKPLTNSVSYQFARGLFVYLMDASRLSFIKFYYFIELKKFVGDWMLMIISFIPALKRSVKAVLA